MSFCTKKIGNGSFISIWEDIWVGGSSLKSQFPRLFDLEMDKQVTVQAKIEQRSFSSFFCRSPRGVAKSLQCEAFSQLLDSVSLLSRFWSLSGVGDFTMES